MLLPLALANQAHAADSGWEALFFGGGHFSGSINVESESGSDKLDVADGPSVGLAVGKDLAEDSAVEVMWTRQDSEMRAMDGTAPSEEAGSLTIDTYHFNGLYFPPQPEGRARWFVLGGIGASVFSPENTYAALTQFSFALGGGTKILLWDYVGLRLDARWSPTLFNTDGTIACSSSASGGRCFVTSSGQVLHQYELTGGVYLRL